MEIGVFGLNDLSKDFYRHWVNRGHKILFADLHLYLGGYAIAELLGPQVSLSLPEKVGRHAEIIVLAVPITLLHAAIISLGDVSQKIVIDMTLRSGDSAPSSSFHKIQRMLPEAKVVRVTADHPFHLHQPNSSGLKTLYAYANDHLAQRIVRWLLDGADYKIIDLNMQTIL